MESSVNETSTISESTQVSSSSSSTANKYSPCESFDVLPKLLSKYHLRHLTKNRVTRPSRRLPSSLKCMMKVPSVKDDMSNSM